MPSSLMLKCSNLKKVLCILVCLKKILMCISILNSHPVILFHAKKVSHLAKQNDTDDDCLKQDLNRLETYFKRRNYPVDILTEFLQKASNLTI